jgi:hypothetical protein
MKKILVPDRTDFAIAKKSRQPERSKPLLHHLSIMVWPAKKALPASVAAAKASPVNGGAPKLLAGADEHFIHVFGRRGCGAALKLHGLALARQGAHGDGARFFLGS